MEGMSKITIPAEGKVLTAIKNGTEQKKTKPSIMEVEWQM